MSLSNCEIKLFLIWSSTCVITDSPDSGTLAINDTKLYVSVVTLSAQNNVKLLDQIKLGFKWTVNWKKY